MGPAKAIRQVHASMGEMREQIRQYSDSNRLKIATAACGIMALGLIDISVASAYLAEETFTTASDRMNEAEVSKFDQDGWIAVGGFGGGLLSVVGISTGLVGIEAAATGLVCYRRQQEIE